LIYIKTGRTARRKLAPVNVAFTHEGEFMYKHIMLPLEGSDDLSKRAVQEAVSLAHAIGAKLTLFTVVPPYHTGVTTPLASGLAHEVEAGRDEEHRARAQKIHADITARTIADGVECESLVVIGASPYERIIENAQARGCDLIVMGSHARTGLDALLTGSETVGVLTHSKVPVLVVR
jgi:nucleotide-binding universal stress UspA family protein